MFVGAACAGCALFEKDAKYNNAQIVARVGKDISITKKELVDGFNSFGYNYVSQGMSLKEAYNQTLDSLIGREIAARVSIQLFGYGALVPQGKVPAEVFDLATGKQIGQFAIKIGNETRVGVTLKEAEEARKTAFDYIESSYRAIEKEIREQMGFADPTAPETEEAEKITYKPYNKYIVKKSGLYYDRLTQQYIQTNYAMNLEKYRDSDAPQSILKTNEDFLDYLTMPRGDTVLEKSVRDQTLSRLVRNLASGEKGLKYKYDTEEQKRAAITRELVRIEIEIEKNALVTRLEKNFELGIKSADSFGAGLGAVNNPNFDKDLDYSDLDYEKFTELRYSNFPRFEKIVQEQNRPYVESVVNRAKQNFRENVKNARFRFDNGFDKEASYYDKVLDDLKSLYFVPRNVADKFFTVSHILLGYSDEQTAQITAINEKFNQDRNVENRDRALDIIKAQLVVTPNPDAIPEGFANPGEMNAEQALAYIKNYVAPDNKFKDETRKAADFRDMIYMFNSDPGMQNPDFEYVIGADTRKNKNDNSTEADNMSRMVPEFTKASRELFKYDYNLLRGTGTKGSMSGLVWTDYGAHIIMYTRDIADFVFTNSATLLDDTYENFLFAPTTSYGEKTYFDTAVESITRPEYARYEQQIIADYKGENKVTLYKSKYKDLTKTK
jgi:hypothetical protein